MSSERKLVAVGGAVLALILVVMVVSLLLSTAGLFSVVSTKTTFLLVLVYQRALPALAGVGVGWPFALRVTTAIAVLLPLGLCLGAFMPIGLRTASIMTSVPTAAPPSGRRPVHSRTRSDSGANCRSRATAGVVQSTRTRYSGRQRWPSRASPRASTSPIPTCT